MKKEMMILVDTANKFEDIVSAARYAEHKEELLEKYKTIVEFAPRNSHSLPKLVMNCVKCNFK